MVVTVDLVRFRRRRDALRLLWRPLQHYSAQPSFARSLLRIQRWRTTDLSEIAVVAAWDGEPAPLKSVGPQVESWRGVFAAQQTHGTLAGEDPFQPAAAAPTSGPGVIWTCGSCKVRSVPAFLRQNDRVVLELNRAPGLLTAFGVMGFWKQGPWMCTLSFWEDVDAGLAFAYRNSPQHREAIRGMRGGKYGTSEAYFARLGPLASAGTIAGRDPFASPAEAVAA